MFKLLLLVIKDKSPFDLCYNEVRTLDRIPILGDIRCLCLVRCWHCEPFSSWIPFPTLAKAGTSSSSFASHLPADKCLAAKVSSFLVQIWKNKRGQNSFEEVRT